MEIKTIEVSGLAAALSALKLPYNKEPDSVIEESETTCCTSYNTDTATCELMWENKQSIYISKTDIRLLQTLIKRGDSHAKPMRGILAYAKIEAPIDFFVEIETHRFGHERLFSASTMHTEGRSLTGHALREAKNAISYGRPITKIDFFSYQALRNMVYQRHNHRLPEWHFFIEWVKTLPLAKELILIGLDEQIAIHNEYMRKYNNNEI